MKAFLAILLSFLTVTGDASFTGYPISGQNIGNTGAYAQKVHILLEEPGTDEADPDSEEETVAGCLDQETEKTAAGYLDQEAEKTAADNMVQESEGARLQPAVRGRKRQRRRMMEARKQRQGPKPMRKQTPRKIQEGRRSALRRQS